MTRGALTPKIKSLGSDFLGEEFTQSHLRLIPYLHYTMCNEQRLSPEKLNDVERKILKSLRDRGHIEGGVSGMSITKEFWDFMNEILWLAYVNYSDQGEK